jgi:hypothetical protein
MSYNGSGTFNINTTGQPVVAGTVITASAFNALTTDLATGLTTAITKDGQTTTTARITFAQGITSSLVTDSSSVSTGSIITGGGVGIAKNLYVGGIASFSAQPIFSSLTASSAVATDASKGLVSVTNTGTGNNVLDTAPTISLPVINNIKMGYSTTATAAGTTTLTASSNYRQFFTGTLAQTIVLPVTSTLVTGMAYEIENNSTGTLTVNSSGGNLVGTIPSGVCAHAVCIGTTLTTAADWDWDYISTTTITGTGANVLATSPTLITPALGTPSALVLTNATGLPASAMPSGSIVQTVVSCPSPTLATIASASWTEASSLFRVSITPKSASNTLFIQCIFMFGGDFTSNISHFKIYDITNSADVNLSNGDGNRTPVHGAARQVDADLNDVDQMVLSVSTSAGSTSARTYGLYSKNESGTIAKYFFSTASNASAIGIARPTFIVHEIAA